MTDRESLRQMRLEGRREIADLMGDLRSAATSLEEERKAYLREKAGRDEERARARRSGELGPELQRVQARIDAGQTTWEDVIAGRDDDRASRQVRERIETNLNTLAEHMEDDAEFQEEGEAVRAYSRRIDNEMGGG